METKKKKASRFYRLAYGTSEHRRKKGLPGPIFDLTVLGLFAAVVIGSLG